MATAARAKESWERRYEVAIGSHESHGDGGKRRGLDLGPSLFGNQLQVYERSLKAGGRGHLGMDAHSTSSARPQISDLIWNHDIVIDAVSK